MVQRLEAIFEQGVLRPVEPLSLPEKQRVLITITSLPVVEKWNARKEEQEWLEAHQHEYKGQWVALQGNALISYGSRAQAVLDEAHQKGIERPLLYQVPDDPDEPSAGWL
jgi:predicted DNA-binding antitoxin AbrB/MazE fold protein